MVAQKKATKVTKKFVKEIGDAVQVLAQGNAQQENFRDTVTRRMNAELGF